MKPFFQVKKTEKNPSRQKFRIAKEVASELARTYGGSLAAVFVTGSVAANMAIPESDIDLIAIGDNSLFSEFEKGDLAVKRIIKKRNTQIIVLTVKKENFENPIKMKILPFEQLMHGAIPIFGDKEYLKDFEGFSYRKPMFEGIKARYSSLVYKKIKRAEKPAEAEKRIVANSKKARQRFLPR